MRWPPAAKFLTAVVGAALTWSAAVIASPSGPVTAGEWWAGAAALAAALGVYAVPNGPALRRGHR